MRKLRKICLTFIFACLMGVTLFGGFACKKDEQVTLTFNVNGGVSISEVKLDEGETYVLPTPTREGYSFEGWYASADFSGDPVTEVVANADGAYYAKWEQLYLVTLELNGGTLNSDTLYLKEGDVIYDCVKSYAPTKAGYQFGDWFVDEAMTKVLGKNTRMTEGGVTLYANYKVPYTVEIWTEKLSEKGTYEKTTEDVVGYEYVGVTYTSEQKVTGFREVILDSEEYKSVITLEISETASENVFRHYFNRESFTVSFNANYPDGSASENVSVTALYGEGVALPYDYTYNGYCLMGWEANGKVYEANYIENFLYGNTSEVEAEKFYPERNTTLYAVWLKGYEDMFGNGDYIYLIEDIVVNEETSESKTVYSVYLSRGGVLFEGEYQSKQNKFTFTNVNGSTALQGKLNENGTFIYSDPKRADVDYQRFIFGKGLVEEKLLLGEYNEVTYSSGEEGVSPSVGTFSINEEGYYVATFESGALAGQTLTMTIGYVPASNGTSYTRAFQIRNEKECEMGEMVRFAVTLYEGNTYLNYYIYYTLTLDGYNTATMCVGEDSYETYHYIYNESTSVLNLYNTDDYEVAFTGEIMTLECFDGQVYTGYAEYNKDLYTTVGYNGGTLNLDGYFNLTYKRADGTVLETYYTTTESILGGTLLSFLDGDKLCKVMIKVEDVSFGDVTYKSYSIEEKSENYGEYYYLGDSGLAPYPLLIVNGEKASFYGYNSSVGYVEASIGSFEYDEATGLYTYKAEEILVSEDDDLAKLEEVVLSLDAGETSYYSLHYWYSYKEANGEAVNCDVSYTSEKGGKLTLVSGIAIYEQDGSIIKGIYSKTSDGVVAIQNASGQSVYVKVNEENHTFVTMKYAPYTAYLFVSNGQTLSSNETLSFDGLGGAIYTVKTTVGEETVTNTYEGTVTQADTSTMHGVYVYIFTYNEGGESFRFIQLTSGNYACFAKENTEFATTYDSEQYGRLELDGYEFYATYEGVVGYYYILSETEIVVELDGVSRYFDIDGSSFTLRGVEYGYYVYSSNQYMHDVDFLLDGYGGLTVITYDQEGNESEQQGTYTQDGDVFTLVYQDADGNPIWKKGKLGVSYITYGGQIYPITTFVEDLGDDVSQIYVNPEDLSILELDSYGNAVKYTKNGVKENGTYLLITDTLLYYVNEAENDACVYTYDKEAGVATIVSLTQKGYYTQELESLIFTQYGFAYLENQTRYYYYVEYDENDTERVMIYREAESGEDATEYGFVEIEFGEFSAVKEYDGKTYYANDGYTVVFKRDAETATQYDAGYGLLESLSFTPSGEKEFSVLATVVIDGETYEKRPLMRDAEGNTYLYVDLYCYDIELSYLGLNSNGTTNSTYKITRMREMVTASPYGYSYYAMLYYFITGTVYENEEGQLSIVREYTLQETEADGEKIWTTVVGDTYFVTDFLEKSNFYDTDGNIVAAPAGTLVYDAEGNVVTLDKIDLTGGTAYRASFTSAGYTYHFHFALVGASYTEGAYEFYLYSFTREEVLSYTDEASGATYELTLERTIRSDISSYKLGTVYNMKLVKTVGDVAETLEAWAWYTDFDGNLQVITREMDGDTILSSVYYTFTLEQYVEVEEEGSSEEDTGEVVNKNPLPIYTSIVAVKETAVTTIYTADAKGYVDITADTNEAMVLCVDEVAYIVYSTSYNAETGVYTISLSDTLVYNVTVQETEGNKYITIEQVEIQEESEE